MISNDEAKRNIAANVCRLMQIHRYDQTTLAEASGENQMQISRICRGAILANVATLSRIAEALDTTMDKLIAYPPAEKTRRSA